LTNLDWTEPENGTDGTNKTNGADLTAKIVMPSQGLGPASTLCPYSNFTFKISKIWPNPNRTAEKVLFPGNKK
jgi:hypothetical protein